MFKRILLITFALIFLLSAQDRSVLYNNGNPIGITTGNLIYKNDSLDVRYSNRVFVLEDNVLERVAFYLGFSEYPDSIFFQVQMDNMGLPGEMINEWQVMINPNYPDGGSYQVLMVDECIQMDAGTYIWVTLLSKGNGILKWVHTDEIGWPFTRTLDGGVSWSEIMTTNIGANIVYAEQIYYEEPIWGDVNGDLLVNVVDIVEIVQHILGFIVFSDEQFHIADSNQDGEVNVIDILSAVNSILESPEPMPVWLLEDINNNSESFGQSIGPESYVGNISCYYFGKAG